MDVQINTLHIQKRIKKQNMEWIAVMRMKPWNRERVWGTKETKHDERGRENKEREKKDLAHGI